MDDSQGCCLCLLFLLFVGLYPVNGTISIYGCLGDAVKLFQVNGMQEKFAVSSIYKKNLDDHYIMSVFKNGNKTVHSVKNGQNNRMFPDQNGNIWIIDLHISDEGTYLIKIDAEIYEVTLLVIIPPTKNCIPKIIRVDNSLSAHLKADDCGRPAASVYWLEHPGIHIAREVIKFQSRNDNAVYHACIEGDALKCSKISNVSNFCSVYSDSRSEQLPHQEVIEDSNPGILHCNVPCTSPGITAVLICNIAIAAFVFLLFGLCIVRRTVKLCQRRKMQSDSLNSVDPVISDGSNPSNVVEQTPLLTVERETGCSKPSKLPEQISCEKELIKTEREYSQEGESQLLIIQGLAGGSIPSKIPEQISGEEDTFESLQKHPGEGTTPKSFVTTRRGAIPMHPVEDYEKHLTTVEYIQINK